MTPTRLKRPALPRVSPASWLPSAPSAIRDLLEVAETPGVVSFAMGLPVLESIPTEAIRTSCDRVLGRDDRAVLQYTPAEGLPALRDRLATLMTSRTGLRFDVENILVTSGAQQALDLLARAYLEPGATAYVERPTYTGTLAAWQPWQPSYAATPVPEHPDPGGAGPPGRLAYVQPTFRNPDGRTLPQSDREWLASWGRRAGTMLIEDDPYADLAFPRTSVPPPLIVSSAEGEGPYRGTVTYLGPCPSLSRPD